LRVFHAETYKAAAQEHVTAALELYNSGRYVLSCYVAGVSVECLLRGYRGLIDPEFDAKHDLLLLGRASRWWKYLPESSQLKAAAALKQVFARWENAHRYRPLRDYRRFLRSRGLHQGIRGDFAKEQTRRAVDAAAFLVRLGVASWPHR
jgi:HEPN domain-containing protein